MDFSSGRIAQKQRTRKSLLSAAREILSRNAEATVASAADAAKISRATAYRYFSTNDALIREAVLETDWSAPEEVVGDAVSVHERVERVHRYLFAFTRQHESAHRLFLAKALEDWVTEGGKPKSQLRGARRVPMFAFALEPLRGSLSTAALGRLVLALSAASGIEAYIALKDVCSLSDEDTDEISLATILTILNQGIRKR